HKGPQVAAGAASFAGTRAAVFFLKDVSGSMASYSPARVIYELLVSFLETSMRLAENLAAMLTGAKVSRGAKMETEAKTKKQDASAANVKSGGTAGGPKYVYRFGAGKADGS